MQNVQMANDIIAFLDGAVAQNVGHLNVDVEDANAEELGKIIETRDNMDCAKGNLACKIPNLDAGIDSEL